ncbi:NlpC/P60 family protein (plasmid) [Streptomyces sp. BI20]|uniref:C40 family peptidase n=1 Tax=Streptomyces sp. BI20 TaxID=3403460 RepID=UPI003C74EAEF
MTALRAVVSLVGAVGASLVAGAVFVASGGVGAAGEPGVAGGYGTAESAGTAWAGVPGEFRPWIERAVAACARPALSPALLAAQLRQESGFRTTRTLVSSAGARGPAQFVPGTWATWGRDADGNGRADPYDVGDAVLAQGALMCSLLGEAERSGFPGDPRALALAGYNAGWGAVRRFRGVPPPGFARGETHRYVTAIMRGMADFRTRGDGAPGPTGAGSAAGGPAAGLGPGSGSRAARDAVRRAGRWVGTPYAYGGGGPAGPGTGHCAGGNGMRDGRCVASRTVGFDCSALVQYAYWPHRRLPRTAAAQFGATSDRPVARAALRPGDLVFWSRPGAGVHHVALYVGDGRVLHAPRTGRAVELAVMDEAMPRGEYHGATRVGVANGRTGATPDLAAGAASGAASGSAPRSGTGSGG